MGLQSVVGIAIHAVVVFILTVIVMPQSIEIVCKQKSTALTCKDNILVRLNATKPETLKNELYKYNNIMAVSAASHVPAAGTSQRQ